jgi:hypothetical protein
MLRFLLCEQGSLGGWMKKNLMDGLQCGFGLVKNVKTKHSL